MSHELQYLDADSDYNWGESISLSDYNYFYVPSIPEWAYSEFDGLLYEGVQYNWNEVDYRLSVEYPAVPEPASASVIIGIIALACIAYKQFKKIILWQDEKQQDQYLDVVDQQAHEGHNQDQRQEDAVDQHLEDAVDQLHHELGQCNQNHLEDVHWLEEELELKRIEQLAQHLA